jgi:pSer/pThr/pTyr-binding forkhead associated (FHA) protein
MDAVPRSWLIGCQPDCDLVVNQPTVSGYHCRLSRDGLGYILRDLSSTNGTFVNGRRITAELETRISESDVVTLGQAIPMPWPDRGSAPGPAAGHSADREPKVLAFRGRTLVLGRDPECDVVIDAQTASGRHARLVQSGGRFEIEDLGSTNGTFVNGLRVNGRAPVAPGDRITLGLAGEPYIFRVEAPEAAAQAMQASHQTVAHAPTPGPSPDLSGLVASPAPSTAFASGDQEHTDLAVLAGQSWFEQWSTLAQRGLDGSLSPASFWARRAAAALALPVILALVVVLWDLLDRSPAPLAWPQFASVLAAKIGFGMVLALLFTGIISFLPELLFERPAYLRGRSYGLSPSAYLAAKLAGFLPLVLLQVAVFQAITYPALGLKGPVFAVFAVLALTAANGVVVALMLADWRWRVFPAALVLSVVWAGLMLAVPAMQAAEPMRSFARYLSSLTPIRWAFEALLVLESDQRPTWIPDSQATTPESEKLGEADQNRISPEPGKPIDLAEASFHAASERMGPFADILALGAMLLTLLGWGYALLCLPLGGASAEIDSPAARRRIEARAAK